jgi:uncharacterized Rossmann fold enzyme
MQCLVVIAMLWNSAANAMDASPHPFNLVQPDGSYVTVVAHGDEIDNWVTDLDGKPEKFFRSLS